MIHVKQFTQIILNIIGRIRSLQQIQYLSFVEDASRVFTFLLFKSHSGEYRSLIKQVQLNLEILFNFKRATLILMAAIVPAIETGAAIGTAVGGPPGALIGAALAGGGAIIMALYLVLRQDTKQAKEQALKKKDPVQFRRAVQKLTKEYILSLSNMDLKNLVSKKSNKTDVVFFGETSAGKSSLINTLYGLNLKIGVGSTTNTTSMVLQDEKKRVWDSVGQNQDFQFYEIDTLMFFNAVDIIFIVYRDTIKKIQHMVKLICLPQNVRYKVYFVRSQCDQWKIGHSKSIDEEIESDYQILAEYGVKGPNILKSSATVQQALYFKNENSKILKIIEDGSK